MVFIEAGRIAPSQEPEKIRFNLHEGHHLTPHLTPHQKDVLGLMARGLSVKEITKELSINSRTVRNHKEAILDFFGATNSINAVLLAHDKGLLDNEFLKSLDKKSFSKLTERQLEVLHAMTKNNGENSSSKEIGNLLFVSSQAVNVHLHNIKRKINLNRMQSSLLYAEAKKTKNTVTA